MRSATRRVLFVGGCQNKKRAKTHAMLSTRMMTVSNNATSMVQDSQTQMDAMTKDIVNRFFSLDTTRPLGVAPGVVSEPLGLAPELRAQRMCFMAEIMALTCGLMLFFTTSLWCQSIKNGRHGRRTRTDTLSHGGRVVHPCHARRDDHHHVPVSVYHDRDVLWVRNTTVTTVVLGGAQAFAQPFFGTAVLSLDVRLIRAEGRGPMPIWRSRVWDEHLEIFLVVYFPYAGHNFDTTVPLSAYHQTKVYKELLRDALRTAWNACGGRLETGRRSSWRSTCGCCRKTSDKPGSPRP